MEAELNHRYRILQALGAGGFGKTYLAEDTYLPSRRRCVIKQLQPVNRNPELYALIQARFQREAVILEELGEGHPQIPRLYAYFSEQGQFYLVQEWIPGETLQSSLQQDGVWSARQVQQFLLEILEVLGYVHCKGIIHRDLKPSNILLREGKPVLIDFGISKELMRTSPAGGFSEPSIAIGTPGFMPLEQAAGKPTFASDLYSLGLTAIYLLTGRLPQQFESDSRTGELFWQPYAPGVTAALANTLTRLIKPNVYDRYDRVDAVRAALVEGSMASAEILEALTLPGLEQTQEQVVVEPLPDNQAPVLESLVEPEVREPPQHPSRQSYRYRQILLNKVKNYWIKGVLERSLQGRVWIELGLEERQDALEHPWGLVWESGDRVSQALPPGTRIADHFQSLGLGRSLLILGEPGSGKTTTLLQLAQSLIEVAERSVQAPLPVVLNLSSWSQGSLRLGQALTLESWVVQELNHKYQVAAEITQKWLQEEHLLLLLDGLDEVSAVRREECLQAINRFHQQHGSMELVVCSRIQDYQALSEKLQFQGAILIQPLSLEQVNQYLAAIGTEVNTLMLSLRTDPVLQELARSPLMLSIMTLAYWNWAPTDQASLSLEDRQQHLFDRYIQRMFERRGDRQRYDPQQSKHWLSWLAQRLVKQSETIFLLERLQPDWLSQPWQYRVGMGVLGGLLAGGGGTFNVSLVLGTQIGHLAGLILGLAGAMMALLIYGWFNPEIKPVETFKWSWKKARSSIPLGFFTGLIFGLIYGVSAGVISGFISGPHTMLLDAITYGSSGLGVGLIVVLLQGLTGPGIEVSTIPNQAIWRSSGYAAAFALIGMAGLLPGTEIAGIPMLFGVTISLLFGLFGVGEASIKHLVLRILLWLNGNTPWNYARFLDYATERILLQKVGGGYIFIHRLLLEHFARMQPVEPSDRPRSRSQG